MKRATLAGLYLAVGLCSGDAQIVNGNFENFLNGWSYNAGVFYIGHPITQPIGVGGNYAADLGGAEITGSQLWQSVPVVPQARYRLAFYSASNGDRVAGRIAVGRAQVEDPGGNVLQSITVTNVSPGYMIGDTGFTPQSFDFNASTAGAVTVRFLDLTPNGGYQIDWAIDAVSMTLLSLPTNSPNPVLVNGDFEDLLAGWTYNPGVYIIGHPIIQPIGIDGNYAADLGGAEITGSELWQSVQVVPQAHYRLTFYSASNGDREEGRLAAGRAQVEDLEGNVIDSITVTNISPGFMIGDLGFVKQRLDFKVPKNIDAITIRFVDLTPNGGYRIDWAIDDVSLTQTSRLKKK